MTSHLLAAALGPDLQEFDLIALLGGDGTINGAVNGLVMSGATLPMGPDLQYTDERNWDPLSFDIYPAEPGRTEFEVSDDRRQLRMQLTVDERTVVLEGGPLDYVPVVRIHRADRAAIEGRLGGCVELT